MFLIAIRLRSSSGRIVFPEIVERTQCNSIRAGYRSPYPSPAQGLLLSLRSWWHQRAELSYRTEPFSSPGLHSSLLLLWRIRFQVVPALDEVPILWFFRFWWCEYHDWWGRWSCYRRWCVLLTGSGFFPSSLRNDFLLWCCRRFLIISEIVVGETVNKNNWWL